MFKKVAIALVLVISLMAVPTVFATDPPASTGSSSGSNPPPEGNLDSAGFMFDLSSITHTAIKGTTRQSWIRQGINYFFERGINVMATVIGSLSVLMLSVGGFLMLSSAGDETQYEKGKNYAKYSLIGLGVTLMAYVLVTLVQLLITSIYG
jgi:hypothetical protein